MAEVKEVVVKFVEHHTPYAKGDVASFEAEKAEELIDKGVAVEHVEKKK